MSSGRYAIMTDAKVAHTQEKSHNEGVESQNITYHTYDC